MCQCANVPMTLWKKMVIATRNLKINKKFFSIFDNSVRVYIYPKVICNKTLYHEKQPCFTFKLQLCLGYY